MCNVSQHCKEKLTVSARPSGFMLPIDTIDTTKFKPNTNALFRAMQAKLKSMKDDPGLEQKEQDYGFHFFENNWLQDESYSTTFMDTFAYDWMHAYVENGVFDTEMHELQTNLQKHGYGCKSLNTYLEKWRWPRAYATGANLCKHAAHKADDKDVSPSGTASEYVSVAPVYAKWLQQIPVHICRIQVESMLLCIRVLVLLQLVITGAVSASDLADAMQAHFEKHREAYGDSIWKPKFHYSLHLPLQLLKPLMLLACFVHERKHRVYKRWAHAFTSKQSMERCMLEEVTWVHMQALRHSLIHPALPDERAADDNLIRVLKSTGHIVHASQESSVFYSRTLHTNGRMVVAGDIAFYDSGTGDGPGVGQVYFHCRIDAEYFTCIAPYTVTTRTDNWIKAIVVESPELIESGKLLKSAIYNAVAVGQTMTVLSDWTCL